MPARIFETVAYEQSVMDWMARRNAQLAALESMVTPELVDTVTSLARDYGAFMEPGVISALAQSGMASDPLAVRSVATSAASNVLADGGDFASRTGQLIKKGWSKARKWMGERATPLETPIRATFNAMDSLFEEGVSRPIRWGMQQEVASGGSFVSAMVPFAARNSPWNPDRETIPYSDTGRSQGLIGIQQALGMEEGTPDFGEGFFPRRGRTGALSEAEREGPLALPALEEQYGDDPEFMDRLEQGASNVTYYNGMPLSLGRFATVEVFEPGTRPFNIASGLIDAGVLFGLDPAAIGLGGAARANKLKRQFGVVDGHRPAVDPDKFVNDYLIKTRAGRTLTDRIAATDDFEDIFLWLSNKPHNATPPVRVVNDLVDAKTADDVLDVLRNELGTSIPYRPRNPDSLLSPTRKLPIVNRSRSSIRLLNDLPNDNWVQVDSIDRAVPQLRNYMVNANLDDAVRKDVLNQISRVGPNDNASFALVMNKMNRAIDEKVTAELASRTGPNVSSPFATRKNLRVAERFQQYYDDYAINGRKYATDDVGAALPFPGSKVSITVDGEEIAVPTAHIMEELTSRAYPLFDIREIRRITSDVGRVLDLPGVNEGVVMADAFHSHFWKPLVLARLAWPVRVIMDEQLRMMGAGLDSMFNHPLSWFAYSFGRKGGKLGKGDVNVTVQRQLDHAIGELRKAADDAPHPRELETVIDERWLIQDSEMFRAAQQSREAGWLGLDPSAAVAKGDYIDVYKGSDDYLPAIAEELVTYSRDDVMRRVAGGLDEADMATIAPANSLPGTPVTSHPNLPDIDDAVAGAFDHTATLQRGVPEQVMREYQTTILPGGEVPFLLEHVGDLTNRMMKKVGPGSYGRGDILPKLRQARSVFRGPDLPTEHARALRRNYDWMVENGRFTGTMDDYLTASAAKMQEYADAHRALPVYNTAQAKARDAAVAVGEQRFDDASRLVDELYELAQDEDAWTRMAGMSPTLPETPTGLDAVKEWFWSGGGKSIRADFSELRAKGSHSSHLSPAEMDKYGRATFEDAILMSRQFADDYIDSLATRLSTKTSDNPDLLHNIATGRFGDVDTTIPANRAKLHEFVGEYTDSLPTTAKTMKAHTREGMEQLNEMRRAATEHVFHLLGAVPTNTLSRSPAFLQFYWKRVEGLAPYMDDALRADMASTARVAKLDDVARRISSTTPSSTPRLASFEEVDQLAKVHALNEASSLLYDLNQRSQFMDTFRNIFPFGEAFKEILTTWFRLAKENPAIPRRGQMAIEGARKAGFIYTDENSDEEMFDYDLEMFGYPASGLVSRMLGLPEGERIIPRGRASSLNMATTTVIPGLGPVVSWPLSRFIPQHPDWDWVNDNIFPFGRSEADTPGGFVDEQVPPHWRHLFQALTEGKFDERMWNNTVGDIAKALVRRGEASTSDPDDALDQAANIAQSLFLFRAVSQATAPTGPNLKFEIQDEDGTWATAQVLADEYRTMVDEFDGDDDLATQAFIDKYGLDPLLVTQPKTKTLRHREMSGPGVEWELRNQNLVDELSLTVGLFAPSPGPGEPDEFDYEKYLDAINEGDIETLTAEEQLMAINNIKGWAEYRVVRDEVLETRGDNIASRNFLAAYKSSLQEDLPGFDQLHLSVPEGARLEDMVEELERATIDPLLTSNSALTSTDAYQGLAKYMEARREAIDRIQSRGRARGLTAPVEAAEERAFLQQYGALIADEHPDFQNMWRRVLVREVRE